MDWIVNLGEIDAKIYNSLLTFDESTSRHHARDSFELTLSARTIRLLDVSMFDGIVYCANAT